jgi:hypothetical protein
MPEFNRGSPLYTAYFGTFAAASPGNSTTGEYLTGDLATEQPWRLVGLSELLHIMNIACKPWEKLWDLFNFEFEFSAEDVAKSTFFYELLLHIRQTHANVSVRLYVICSFISALLKRIPLREVILHGRCGLSYSSSTTRQKEPGSKSTNRRVVL